jgi:hypothetical protein
VIEKSKYAIRFDFIAYTKLHNITARAYLLNFIFLKSKLHKTSINQAIKTKINEDNETFEKNRNPNTTVKIVSDS